MNFVICFSFGVATRANANRSNRFDVALIQAAAADVQIARTNAFRFLFRFAFQPAQIAVMATQAQIAAAGISDRAYAVSELERFRAKWTPVRVKKTR